MIRTGTMALLLMTTAAYANGEKSALEIDPAQNLAYCGSQVATLAWFYQGVVNDGNDTAQADLDSLLYMQSVFISQLEKSDEDTIELFKKMTRVSVEELASEMQTTREKGAMALSHVNTNVRGCADIFFEKIEDEDGEDAESQDSDAAEKSDDN